jgi:hypothetical protein
MNWWQDLIYRRYETYGLANRVESALACLAEIKSGRWQVFTYESSVFILGRSLEYPEVGEVHMWAENSNLLRVTRQFMRDAWRHSNYPVLTSMLLDIRMERLVKRLGWKLIGIGALGERYWMIRRLH